MCREWTDNGQLWVQQVSSTPATRLDVVNLQEELERRLQQRQARETGICPVRRELYSQCFGKYFVCMCNESDDTVMKLYACITFIAFAAMLYANVLMMS